MSLVKKRTKHHAATWCKRICGPLKFGFIFERATKKKYGICRCSISRVFFEMEAVPFDLPNSFFHKTGLYVSFCYAMLRL